jgi:DNA repair protein RecO (recombination protein O)
VLQKQDPHPRLFSHYVSTLRALTVLPLNQGILRIFEKKLLEEIGYGLRWHEDFSTGKPLISDKYYQYYPGEGFKQTEDQQMGSFKGEHLLAFSRELLTTQECLRDAKRLMRAVISTLLGHYNLQSRELFQK